MSGTLTVGVLGGTLPGGANAFVEFSTEDDSVLCMLYYFISLSSMIPAYSLMQLQMSLMESLRTLLSLVLSQSTMSLFPARMTMVWNHWSISLPIFGCCVLLMEW